MREPFWQLSMSAWDYEAIKNFVSERIPENEHLDYKCPPPGPERWEVTARLLKVVVAMLNTDGGVVIVGVRSGENNKPGDIAGVRHNDPERAVVDKCSALIEPLARPEIRVEPIPDGEAGAGNKLVVLRVPRGPDPPYSLRENGVFVRIGEQNHHASIDQLRRLFSRSALQAAERVDTWTDVRNMAFGYVDQHSPARGVSVFAACSPLFPVPPIELDQMTDQRFLDICHSVLDDDNALITGASSVAYSTTSDAPPEAWGTYAYAASEGSIGMRRYVEVEACADGARLLVVQRAWAELRRLLVACDRWPRTVCGVERAPLSYELALGNLADVVLTVLPTQRRVYLDAEVLQRPRIRNRTPTWIARGEWNLGEDIDDHIQRHLHSLERQLQSRFYRQLLPGIRATASGRGDGP